VAEALDSRFKVLNKLWEDAEAELRQIPMPEDVVPKHFKSISLDPPNEPRGDSLYYFLGFVKSKGGWRICVGALYEVSSQPPDDDYHWKPITECSLDVRVECVPHIGKLYQEVLKKAEACVPKLDEAIDALRSTLNDW
jgi:hypothetical protein